MAYKRFTLALIAKLGIIFLLMAGISMIYIFLEREQLIFTLTVLGLLLIYLIYDMIRYVNTTNRLLTKFLLSVKHNDFTIHFTGEKSSGSVAELKNAFQEIIEAFKALKVEKEVQYNFLQSLIEIIPIGIIALNQEGRLVLMNSAAQNMLRVKKTSTWDQLGRKIPGFYEQVNQLKSNGRLMFNSGKDKDVLAVQLNSTFLMSSEHKIITFKNIKTEIDLKETEAWIKLIRTLNHEIMNSVTPITSLTETILMILQEDGKERRAEELRQQNVDDVVGSVKTIQHRSNRLIEFIEQYRKLTRVPPPQKENIVIRDLILTIFDLMKAEFKERRISAGISTEDKNLKIYADPVLVEQVLINLVRNSMEALTKTENPEVSIATYLNETGNPCVKIIDNGCGIPAELQDEVFIPFFTTKETGSGIGLSLSRQIMRLHGGTLQFSSTPNVKTAFILRF